MKKTIAFILFLTLSVSCVLSASQNIAQTKSLAYPGVEFVYRRIQPGMYRWEAVETGSLAPRSTNNWYITYNELVAYYPYLLDRAIRAQTFSASAQTPHLIYHYDFGRPQQPASKSGSSFRVNVVPSIPRRPYVDSFNEVPLVAQQDFSERYYELQKQINQVSISAENLQRYKEAFLAAFNKTFAIERQLQPYKAYASQLPAAGLFIVNEQLSREISELNRQLNELLNNRRELLRIAGLSVDRTVSLEELQGYVTRGWEYTYIKNETGIRRLEERIALKEGCLQHNQALQEAIASRLALAQKNFQAKVTPTAPYEVVEKELNRLHQSISDGNDTLKRLNSVIQDYRKKLAEVRKEIEELDHWYKWGCGSELASLREREQNTLSDIKKSEIEIENTKKALRSYQETVKKLEPIAAYGRQCAAEYAQLQKTYGSLGTISGATSLEKERIAALNDTLKTGGAHSKLTYEITQEGQVALKACGVRVETFGSLVGNAFQRQLYKEVCSIINESGKANADCKDIAVRAYLESTLHVCEVANEMIRSNSPIKALAWTKFAHICSEAYDATKAIVRGSITGTVKGYATIPNVLLQLGSDPKKIVDDLTGVIGLLITPESRAVLLQKMQKWGEHFATLPLNERLEKSIEFFTSLLSNPFSGAQKLLYVGNALNQLGRIAKIEAAALQQFCKLEQCALATIKGVTVPVNLAPALEKLASAGKITTAEDVTRWVHFLEAPVGFGITESVTNSASLLKNALPQKKVAEIAAAALAKSNKVEQTSKVAEAAQKVSKEESAKIATSTEKIPTTVAQKVPEGCKAIADTGGSSVGRVDHLPIDCPLDKDFFQHAFRPWVKRGKIKGCHMPAQKQPELIYEITGENAQGIREVTLEMQGVKTTGKTIAPKGWNQVDYAQHVREAYANLVVKECERPGVFKLNGIDKSGITWEMFIELKDGVYKITTGYPKL